MTAREHFHFSDDSHPWVKLLEFNDITVTDLLRIAEQKIESHHLTRQPAFVIDIDSTLFGLGLRFRSIFMAFLRQHNNPPMWAQKAIPHIGPFDHHYTLHKALKMMLPETQRNDPHFETENREFFLSFREFWEKHFFSERHLHFDEPYPGALEFVRELEKLKISIIFLTGRDRPRTGSGTLQSLKKHGFKVNDDQWLVMKPTSHEFDVDFKRRASEMFRRQYNVIGTIDNEPENLVMFSKYLPHSEIIFFHSIMSPRMPSEDIRKLLGERKLHRLKGFL